MEKPLTTDELFDIICRRLEENGKMPDIIEYWNSCDTLKKIISTDWKIYGKVQFGGSEGIYLDIHIEGIIDDDCKDYGDIYIGCIKTCHEGYEAFKTMCLLNADFIFEERAFFNENYRIFEWRGYYVDCYKAGMNNYSFWTLEKPTENWGLFSDEDYDYSVITNCETREYTLIKHKEEV